MLKKIVKKIIRHKSPLDAYQFNIDEVGTDVISGWAHKKGEGNYTANIEIRHNNVILLTTQANLMREDLKQAAIGSGQYGFSVDPTKINSAHDITSIDIFIDGLKANAKPLPLILAATNQGESKEAVAIDTEAFNNHASSNTHQIYLDNVSVEKLVGWAKKKDSVTHRSLVELKVGHTIIGSDTADTFRQSIKSAGIGDGCYCFEVNPKVHLFPASSVHCDLYIDGKKLNATPIELTVTKQALEAAKFAEEFSSELKTFGGSLTQELQRLSDEIAMKDGNAVTVAIENIASLSVRIEVIEQILTKHFANK